MERKKLPCVRDECPYPRYVNKLCAGHYLEENPPAPRTAPMRTRTSPPRRRSVARRAPARRAEGIPAEVVELVLIRAAGLCEACGEPFGPASPHLHHRKRRRDGGHVASNLVALHPECHVVAPQAVHQRPAWARAHGLIVSAWSDPDATVLVLADTRRVLLSDTEPVYLPPPDGVLYAA